MSFFNDRRRLNASSFFATFQRRRATDSRAVAARRRLAARPLRLESLENRELLSAAPWNDASAPAFDLEFSSALEAPGVVATAPADVPVAIAGVDDAASIRVQGVRLSTLYPKLGQTTTANVVPNRATATFQWYRVDATNGGANGGEKFEAILGANSSTYTPTPNDVGWKIRVVATGTGNSVGSASRTTNAVVKYRATPELTSVELSTNAPTVGEPTTANLAQTNASATYRWFRVDADGAATEIVGATERTYSPTAADVGSRLRVVATGVDNFAGSAEATTTGVVSEGITIRLTAVYLSTNSPQIGKKIVATLAQRAAAATYQWYRVDADGTAAEIDGATSSTYTPTDADAGFAIRVVATGTGKTTGVVERTTKNAVPDDFKLSAVKLSTNFPRVDQTVVATVSPAEATATYRWFRVDSSNNVEEIADATESTYSPTAADVGYRLQVVATGVGDYRGSVEKTTNATVFRKALVAGVATPPTAVYLSTNGPQVGKKIVATLARRSDVATYRWYRVDADGTAAEIDGATSSTYTPTDADAGRAIRVVATGIGKTTGVERTTKNPVFTTDR